MAIRPIRMFGDPVLHSRAAPVTTFDKELRLLVADLAETMLAAPGSGLAAPQLGVGLRVFTYRADGRTHHLVNPDLDLSQDQQVDEEGCLSIPDLTFATPRAMRVVARGMNMWGEPVVVEGSAWTARAIQHETDHLDGILFVDRLDAAARREAMRRIRESAWFEGAAPAVKVSPHPTSERWL